MEQETRDAIHRIARDAIEELRKLGGPAEFTGDLAPHFLGVAMLEAAGLIGSATMPGREDAVTAIYILRVTESVAKAIEATGNLPGLIREYNERRVN